MSHSLETGSSTSRRRIIPSAKEPSPGLPSMPLQARSPRRSTPWTATRIAALALISVLIGLVARSTIRGSSRSTLGSPHIKIRTQDLEHTPLPRGFILGHGDFDDGRMRHVREDFVQPTCDGCFWVNTNLGNGGPEPDLSGGMIPAVAPPFAMTRWTPQTRTNYPSMCPYNQTDTKFKGFMGTHQPAIWMGESGPVTVYPGIGPVVTDFELRGAEFAKEDEYASPSYYRTMLSGKKGAIEAELSATSRVGHMRFSFDGNAASFPHVIIDASRASVLMSGDNVRTRSPDNVTFPEGNVEIDVEKQEVYGWNDERQDHILVGDELPAKGFRGYFVARFSEPFQSFGVSNSGKNLSPLAFGSGKELSAYVVFDSAVEQVEVRVGVSFISVEQARRNIDLEIPDGTSLEATAYRTRATWADKLDRLSVAGATPHNLTVLYSSFAHTLVYPYEVSENTGTLQDPSYRYYSGYLDRVVQGISYSGYSIWDTFRAQTAWLLLVAPERVGPMITSMLQDYKEGGWLPMWKNIVETNIMVGTHADSIIAQAMNAGVKDFDWTLAWEAVRKDAFTPPERDTELRFEDREEHTPQEVRAGLTEYIELGFVADDLHSEAGSRTLDYAYDDHAAAIVASHVGASEDATALRERAQSYRNIFNKETGHMEARNSDGSWAGPSQAWTEGDDWAYSLDVMHDVPGLIELMGGEAAFIDFMNRHFDGGHNLHTNEPSHHIPYMYNFGNRPDKAQGWVRHIGMNDYNHTAGGLSGNEDCGQMSAWYLFSAMGFYPLDPASAEYVVGVPFFDAVTLHLPGQAKPINVTAKGASDIRQYIKSLSIDGKARNDSILRHDEIAHGADIAFEMEGTPQVWGMK